MEFSEIYKQTRSLCSFSPDGVYLATAVQNKLVIRNAISLEISNVFVGSGVMNQIAWCKDSDLILTAQFADCRVEIWSVSLPDWKGVIEEAILGLTAARFGPSSDFVLTCSEAQLRLTIWSLNSKEAAFILNPKYSNKGYSYRPDERYLALLERKDGKDHVGIYDTESWILKKHFSLDTIDAADIAWSPDGQFIAVWESCIDYKMLLFSPAGFCVGTYSAHEVGLGIKTVSWSPSSQFLAIGSFDQKLRLLNTFTWEPTITFSHNATITDPKVRVHQELNNPSWKRPVLDPHKGLIPSQMVTEARFLVAKNPFQVPSIKLDPDKPNPKMGVGLSQFNSDGRFLLSRNDNMPRCLWIWELGVTETIAFTCQLATIRDAAWNPVDPDQLVFVCGTNHIYLWTRASGFECVEIPSAQFQASSIHWNPNGLSCVLFSKDNFVVGFTTSKELDSEV